MQTHNFPSLLVYSPITQSNTFIEDIAPYATDYQHSIRRLGGYWTADWRMYRDDMGRALYDQWRSNRLFYDFKENLGGQVTWEGSIEEVTCDDDKGLLNVKAYGYVHSIQHRFNSTTDASTTDADAWIELMRATDCEFIPSSELSANTLQCYKAGGDRVWTEMLKVAELSDGSTNMPWKIGVYNDRRLYYSRLAIPMDPSYWVRGGIRWRVDAMNDLKNYITISYSDESGIDQTPITVSRQDSIDRYGQREEHLSRTRIPTASATALVTNYMYEHAWPFMKAIGSSSNIQVYDSIGCDRAFSPWVVQPGVYQDTTMIGGQGYYYGWLSDISHFLVDEVIASEKGISLRTSNWTEADALDAYYDYLADAPKAPRKKRRRRNRTPTSSGGTGSGTPPAPRPRTRWNTPTPPYPDPEGSY